MRVRIDISTMPNNCAECSIFKTCLTQVCGVEKCAVKNLMEHFDEIYNEKEETDI